MIVTLNWLKEFIDICFENSFIAVQQSDTGKGQTDTQNHNFQPPHQELEIQHKVANHENQPKNGCHQSKGADPVDPNIPVVACACTDGCHQFIGQALGNLGKPAIHYRKADGHGYGLNKANDQISRFCVRVAVRPHDIALKPFFQKLENNQGHAKTQQNVKQHAYHTAAACRRHILIGV